MGPYYEYIVGLVFLFHLLVWFFITSKFKITGYKRVLLMIVLSVPPFDTLGLLYLAFARLPIENQGNSTDEHKSQIVE